MQPIHQYDAANTDSSRTSLTNAECRDLPWWVTLREVLMWLRRAMEVAAEQFFFVPIECSGRIDCGCSIKCGRTIESGGR